jgi:hypothetical protein
VPQPASEVGTLPFGGVLPSDGSAQAIAIGPAPQVAAIAGDSGAPSDTQNLFLLFTVVLVAIPVLLTMTLLATVLTRR